ncbi:MFS transporter [Streptomyces sp. KHY 26]|uniref:MFS transporter n=1 Tax=Streptomyces sp. KHY 26 TaxID=3097359 RepID=UPI00376F2EC5
MTRHGPGSQPPGRTPVGENRWPLVAVAGLLSFVAMLDMNMSMGLAGPLGGRLADRYGARPVAVAGAALTAVGLLLFVPPGREWALPQVAWRLAPAGVGMGLNGGPAQALVMGAAPPGRTATVGSSVQPARGLGFTLGPALATAAWGLAAGDDGPTAGPALAAGAACLAVPLLAPRRRGPEPASAKTTGAATAAHDR